MEMEFKGKIKPPEQADAGKVEGGPYQQGHDLLFEKHQYPAEHIVE